MSRKYGGDIKFTRKHFRQLHSTRFLSSSSNKLFAFFSESDFHFISMIHDVVLVLEFGHFSWNSALIPTLSEWWWHDLEIDIIVHEHGNERQIHEKTRFIIWLTKRNLRKIITKLCICLVRKYPEKLKKLSSS